MITSWDFPACVSSITFDARMKFMNSCNIICNKTCVGQLYLTMVHKECSQLIGHKNKHTMIYGNKLCNLYHGGSLATESVYVNA